ncbi:fructose-1,6-bisphosphatase [Micromonospora pallida]|uniref:Fructose-1,6-bisphosphatase n=1 Tax=Micromonospora pallida TaxID=145854 RepID=A0A1C6SDU1_9ACTN|nr:inositol monophosphatase [Micromonospora pallida]SCL27479.1 fructose-1,6-bisphosphatase [Micromonospora pallida]
MTHPAVTPQLLAAVSEIVRDVAHREIMPRFGALAEGDVSEKGPGDLVTIADQAAEAALTERLTDLLPGSVVVGEEAVAGDASLLDALAGDDPVWIVDPIDGTHNFVHGSPNFGVLVALARGGELLASCTYLPALEQWATAAQGAGAYVDGRRVHVPPAPADLRAIEVVTSQKRWWEDEWRGGHDALLAHGVAVDYMKAAGLEYVELTTGQRGALVGVWDSPWDHAAGLLLYAEAGGVTVTADGSAFRLAGGNALPFVCAPDRATALAVSEIIAAARD